MNEDWLHKIHDRMTGYEIDEPENLWDAIESKRAEAPSTPRSMKGPVMIWVKRSIAVAAMIAVIISAGVYFTYVNQDISETQLLTKTTDNPVSGPENLPLQHTTHNTAPKLSPDNLIAQSIIPAHNNEGASPNQYRDTHIQPPTANNAGTEPDSQNVDENHRAKTDDTPVTDKRVEKNRLPHITDSRTFASTHHPKASASNNLSVSVYSSGGTGSALNYKSKGISFMAVGKDVSDWESNTLLGLLAFNQGKDTETEIKHRLPIRAGISFAYNISKRFGIETGLSYTNLVSDIKEGSKSTYYTGEQQLHYIGIPLNLKYNVLSWKRLDLYASTGALAEKCVSAKIDKEFIFDNRKNNKESDNLSDKPLQWSVNASVGVQCNLISSMSIFVEPGISYYFNDGTDIQTIYKEKPLNFNLNMGIRLTFGKR
ncbi:MAG: PorT family protein [Paramuribaculum sp.]|nr:PorT family protein [Paramuribaculum sp.]